MSIRTILNVCDALQSDDDIRTGADLCVQATAHLSLVVIAIATTPPSGDYAVELSQSWMKQQESDLAQIEKKAEKAKALLTTYGISYQVDIEYAEAAWADNAVGLHARYCDLVFIGPKLLKANMARKPTLDGSLFKSARPVLIAPENIVPALRPRTVLVAWDSRQEAARAVYDAIDMLSAAENVHVTMVDPVASDRRSGAEPGADIATYLARHGSRVTVDRLASAGRPVDEVLKHHASDISADLVVMGAYGHSHLRERIFGGVTESFIDDATVPVLMAH